MNKQEHIEYLKRELACAEEIKRLRTEHSNRLIGENDRLYFNNSGLSNLIKQLKWDLKHAEQGGDDRMFVVREKQQ